MLVVEATLGSWDVILATWASRGLIRGITNLLPILIDRGCYPSRQNCRRFVIQAAVTSMFVIQTI